jgi:hypothetical protein
LAETRRIDASSGLRSDISSYRHGVAPALSIAQREPGQRPNQVTSKEFLQQLIPGEVYLFISPRLADSLITHRVQPVLPRSDHDRGESVWHGNHCIRNHNEAKVRHVMAVSVRNFFKSPYSML